MPTGSVARSQPARIRQLVLRALAAACALLLPAPLLGQGNALTVPRNLAHLVDESELVLEGRVTSVALEPHPQLRHLLTVAVTLQVKEVLKGTAGGSTYTFRQAVIDRREQGDRLGYRVGQQLLLTLIRPNAYGLSSPAGMQQGRFSIALVPRGAAQATNGLGNLGLFHGLDSDLRARGARLDPEVRAMIAEPRAGPLPLDHLKSLIRAISARSSPE